MMRNSFLSGLRQVLTSPASLILLGLLLWLGWSVGGGLLNWAVLQADWQGSTAADCSRQGACWVFVRMHLNRFVFGTYPAAEQWRVLVALLLPLALAVLTLRWKSMPGRDVVGPMLILLGPVFALALIHGGFAGLTPVPTTAWGGLMVTLIVGGLGIVLSLPLGVLLALGRRSRMPLIRVLSVVYIEVWRGVPLLGVLFMATMLLPLLLPPGTRVPQFYGVMTGIVLYAAAYMAEVVRGGLQSIGTTQFEAADALGFGFWSKMRIVILPQALSNVSPALVGIFINLFKSSTLVLVVGVFDLLGIVQNAAQNPDWAGFFAEGYVFVAAVFWIICFAMSSWGETLGRRRNRRNRDV